MSFLNLNISKITSGFPVHPVDSNDCIQCWFVDGSSTRWKLSDIKKWWDELFTCGPKYGYQPLPPKTILIVKEQYHAKSEEITNNTDIWHHQVEKDIGSLCRQTGTQGEICRYVLAPSRVWSRAILYSNVSPRSAALVFFFHKNFFYSLQDDPLRPFAQVSSENKIKSNYVNKNKSE